MLSNGGSTLDIYTIKALSYDEFLLYIETSYIVRNFRMSLSIQLMLIRSISGEKEARSCFGMQ